MKNPLIHLIAAAIILVVTIVAYGLWYVAVDTANAQARTLAGEIRTKGQDAERIAEAKAALTALAVNESSVAQHFVSANDVVPFLSSLESTGKALGAKVDVVSVGADTSGKDKFGHINLALHINGSFNAVVRTLGAFEYAPYDITLTNLTLDTTGAPDWSAAVSLSVGTGAIATSTHVAPKKP